MHGHKAVWEDPVEWVRGTLPWPNAQQDQSRLFHLPPPSIGPPSEDKKPPKDTPPPSTLESDPLVRVKVSVKMRLINGTHGCVVCCHLIGVSTESYNFCLDRKKGLSCCCCKFECLCFCSMFLRCSCYLGQKEMEEEDGNFI